MTAPRVLPYGDRAVLVEVAHPAVVLSLRNALVAQGNPAIRSVVPAARTVLIEYDPGRLDVDQLTALVAECSLTTAGQPAVTGRDVDIAVYYDGPDLAAVAEEIAESVESVIARHTAADYTVQFCGFSPGFAYLTGLDPVLRLPRLASPRSAVPAGSVAIADEYAGIYPRPSPGGWRLLGRTHATLFDLDRDPPALLTAGTRVRFVRA